MSTRFTTSSNWKILSFPSKRVRLFLKNSNWHALILTLIFLFFSNISFGNNFFENIFQDFKKEIKTQIEESTGIAINDTAFKLNSAIMNPSCPIIPDGDFEAGSFPGGGTLTPFAGGNGVDFADQSPNSWSPATTIGGNYWIESTAAHSGDKYVYQFSSGSTAGGNDACSQYDISGLSGNMCYQICVYAADARAGDGSSGLSIEVQEIGGPFHFGSFAIPDNPTWDDNALTAIPWEQFCYSFVTQSGTSAARIWISAATDSGTATTSYLAIDDVSLCSSIPTASISAIQPTCTNGTPNSDGYLQITAVTNGDRYAFSTGNTFTGDTDYANAAMIGALPFDFNMGLSNPSGSQDYTVRIFNGASACFTDVVVTMNEQDCTVYCGNLQQFTIDWQTLGFAEDVLNPTHEDTYIDPVNYDDNPYHGFATSSGGISANWQTQTFPNVAGSEIGMTLNFSPNPVGSNGGGTFEGPNLYGSSGGANPDCEVLGDYTLRMVNDKVGTITPFTAIITFDEPILIDEFIIGSMSQVSHYEHGLIRAFTGPTGTGPTVPASTYQNISDLNDDSSLIHGLGGTGCTTDNQLTNIELEPVSANDTYHFMGKFLQNDDRYGRVKFGWDTPIQSIAFSTWMTSNDDINDDTYTNSAHSVIFAPITFSKCLNCKLDITTIYSENCQEPTANNFTADWKIGISTEDAPDDAISYQRNSEAVQTHTLTGTTDTLTISGIPADGGLSDTLKVWFTNEVTCADTIILKRPIPCPNDVNPCASNSGCLGGNVFEDFNCNGADDTNEPGVQGIQVQVYDCNNALVGTGFSDADGDWQVCGLTDGMAYRIEHILPESIACWATPTHVGGDNGSDIQFLTAPACTQFSVSSPDDYCHDNPNLITACYVTGDPLLGGTAATADVIVGVPYNTADNGEQIDNQYLANGVDVGSVWGETYQRGSNLLFTAAFLKRHVGLGTDGLGAIYRTDLSTNTSTPYIDLTDFGYSAGSVGARGLPANIDDASFDVPAISTIGKVGFGGMDLSDDENQLFTINLFDKQLYRINIGYPAKATIVGADIQRFAIPDPGCNLGEWRPFAVKVHKNKIFVGGVCSAENGGTRNDLIAYIYEFNIASSSFNSTPVLSIPLDYQRGYVHGWSMSCEYFNPWNENYTSWTAFDGNMGYCNPQPILSDIEIDNDGDMVLGFMDRAGHVMGHLNYPPDPTEVDNRLIFVQIAGEILRADFDGIHYTLENAGTTPSGGGCGAGALNLGPGGGEYYCGENFGYTGSAGHAETMMGGLFLLPGEAEIVATLMDPLETWSGGFAWLSNSTGQSTKLYEIYQSVDGLGGGTNTNGTGGKANGLANITVVCDPAPLEIGNYVWCDSLQNGIQDACERGINNILVSLYDRNGNLVGQDTTSNSGQYYFNQNNVDSTGITVNGSGIATPTSGNFTGMSYSTQYFIVFGGGQFATNKFTVGSDAYGITPVVNTGSNDNIDSDVDGSSLTTGSLGARPDGLPFIDMTTAPTGCGDHKYDLGVTCSPTYSLGNQVFTDTDNSGDLNGAEAGIDGVQLQLLNSDGSVYDSDPNTAGDQALTVTTANGGYYRFDDLPAGNYIVEVVSTNFTTGNNLENFVSSTGANQEADPDSDADINDNGLDTQVSGATRSGVVTLGNPEPTGETEPSSYGAGSTTGTAAADLFSNLTVDFGFYPCPTLTVGSKNPTTCGGTDGEIQIGGLAASTSYTLNFMKDAVAQTAQTIMTNGSGNYVITGLDAAAYTAINVTAAGCTSNDVAATLNDPGTPAIVLGTVTNPSTCAGTDGSIQLTGLTANTTYSLNYTKDGTPVAAANVMTDASGNYLIAGLEAATYTAINVTLTGCTSNSVMATLADPGTPAIVLGTVTNPSTCAGTDGSIQLTGLTANTTYSLNYTKDGTPVAAANVMTDASGNYLIAGLDAAAYTAINVTAAGCTSNDVAATLNDPGTPAIVLGTVTNPSTCAGTDGSIQLTGLTANTTYSLNYTKDGTPVAAANVMTDASGNYVLSGLDAAAYTAINVTAAGCTSNSVMATLNDPSTVTLALGTTTNPTICSGSDGTIQITAMAASTAYVLNFMKDGVAQAAQNINSDASGNYTISGLDAAAYTAINVTAAGCTSNSVTATLNDPSTVTLALGTTANPTICSGSDGTIQITGMAASTAYALNFMKDGVAQAAQNINSDASGNFTISGLDAAAYTAINVTAAGCTSNSVMATLNDPSTVTLALGTTTNPTICSGSDGTIQITGMAASTAYALNFMKDGVAQAAQNINSDASGNYTISGLDAAAYTAINVTAAGCTSNSVTATLNDPSTVTLALGTTANPTICSGSDGTIQITGMAASTAYLLNFMKDGVAQAAQNINSDASGNYTISGLDAAAYTAINVNAAGCTSNSVAATLSKLCYSLGNQVFTDTDNSGDLNGSEIGIDGVQMQLLNADGSIYDSDLTTAGTQALTVTTGNGGYYRFDNLAAGNYIVEVVASNFTASNPLENLTSSTGASQEADPETGGDLNDNGLDALVNGAIRSGIVTLGNPEPTGEVEPGSYPAGSTTGIAAADAFSNLTVDFGFYVISTDNTPPNPLFPQCPEQPCHVINTDLKMGTVISADPSISTTDDADGTVFPNNLRAGTQIRVRTTIMNNTGSDAYLYAWADFNNDNDFDDAGENFIVATYPAAMFSGMFEVSNAVFIPSDADASGIAMRFRLSTDPTFINVPCSPGGCAPDGEVEDYLIQLECPPTICLPPSIQINRD